MVKQATYSSCIPAPRQVRLATIVTAFRRDDEVQSSISRFAASSLPKAGHRLLVIDNGRTLHAGSFDWGAIIPNPNLGGAGGFTRGLLEAKAAAGFTHALFMDDDASCHFESIDKTIACLNWAKDDALAISGSMLLLEQPWIQHEAGARFHSAFGLVSVSHNLDLREKVNVLANEAGGRVDYGAWWFFAFPLKHAKNYAFPFFVRGDDQQFSRANTFSIATMNGIACWQQRFDDKATPSVDYLAHRADFVIGLMRVPDSFFGRVKLVRQMARPIFREALAFRYGFAHARCDAVDDVFKGPAFFEQNLSALPRLAQLKAKYASFYAADIQLDAKSAGSIKKWRNREGLWRLASTITIGGHLLPNALLSERSVIIPFLHHSGSGFLRKNVVYYSPRVQRGFVVKKSLPQLLGVTWRYLGQALKLLTGGAELRKRYQERLPYLQSEEFWRRHLELPKAEAIEQHSDTSGSQVPVQAV